MAKNRPSPSVSNMPERVDSIAEMVSQAKEEAASEIVPVDPDSPSVVGVDPEIDRLRRELAEKELALEAARAELATAAAAAQPLPDEGPGEYEIVLRHAPSRLKKFRVEATNGEEAWQKFCREAVKKSYNPKDKNDTAIKAFENYIRQGRLNGFDRAIKKVG